MYRIQRLCALALLLLVGACDAPITSSQIEETEEGTTLEGPRGDDYTLGGITQVTTSASDVWPELEGDFVAWYRPAPAAQEGLWLMDLRTGEANRIWTGTVLSAFDMVDGEIFWGSAAGLHTYDIASGSLATLASGFRQYRDISVGPRYIVGTANQSSDRPFVFDRALGTEVLIPTPTSVPATRGWEDWVLYTDNRESLQRRQFYLHHIPTGVETPITAQDQLLTSGNSDVSGNRVVYFDRRFCPGGLQLYDMEAATTTPVDLPGICPTVVFLDGDVMAYRHNASGGIIYLGFLDVVTGESVELELANPGNWRIDADLDGTRVVHTSAGGLTLVDLRFSPPQPPVANAGGPYEVLEGSTLVLDGSASYSMTEAALTYLWTLPDGTTLGGATPSWSWADDGSYTVTLTVSEEGGLSGDAQATVEVLNAAPTLVLGDGGISAKSAETGLSVEAGTPFSLNASFSDAGLMDAPWLWSVTWDLGELASGTMDEQGALPTVTWTPEEAGSYTVVVRVVDKDGGVAEADVALEVLAKQEEEPQEPEAHAVRIHAGIGPRHNVVAWRGRGLIPVVVFGSPEVPVREMDRAAFRLGEGGAEPLSLFGRIGSTKDLDRDGKQDLLLWFRIEDAGIEKRAEEVCLTGATREGMILEGCSPIKVRGF